MALPMSGNGDFARIPHASRPRDPGPQFDAKSTYFAETLIHAGLHGGDSMKESVRADRIRSVPSIVPSDIPALSDDECVARLARAIERHDSDHLDEVAQLIGRLAVTIE